jgi:hypothetical protein
MHDDLFADAADLIPGRPTPERRDALKQAALRRFRETQQRVVRDEPCEGCDGRWVTEHRDAYSAAVVRQPTADQYIFTHAPADPRQSPIVKVADEWLIVQRHGGDPERFRRECCLPLVHARPHP